MQFSLWPKEGASTCGTPQTVGPLKAQNALKVLERMGNKVHIFFFSQKQAESNLKHIVISIIKSA